jgi:aminoglycoside phosphotransferase (APT) family kinase protein
MEDTLEFLRGRIPPLASAVSLQRLKAGYSPDAKYLVAYADGTKVFLRLAPSGVHQRQRVQARLLDQLRIMGVRAPKPLSLGLLDDLRSYSLLSYIDGNTASDALPKVAEDTQYAIGVEAGTELLKMHQLEPPPGTPCVDETAKHMRYRVRYRKCGIRLEREDEIAAFIDANVGALRDRPNRFRHGDFHVGNIVVRDQQYAGAVDFESHDWGDPFQEFVKVGFFSREVSVPFCIGQIRAYFGDHDPPDSFWRLYAVYLAMTSIASVVWALQATPDEVQEMVDLISRVVDDHSAFQSAKPKWYPQA